MRFAIIKIEWGEPMDLNGVSVSGIWHKSFLIEEVFESLELAQERMKVMNENQYANYAIIQMWTK